MTAGDMLTAVLLPAGAAFAVLGAVGMLVLPDLVTRLPAAAKPQTLGLVLVVAGIVPQLSRPADAAPLLLVVIFQLSTVPIVAGTLGRIAHHTGAVRDDRLTADELRSKRTRNAGGGGAGARRRAPAPRDGS
jgi:multicomponent Na+:H+ antiporter subunit G